MAHLILNSSLTNSCTCTSLWIKTAQPPFWPPRGQQVLHQRWISEINCSQATKHASKGSTLALRPITSPNRGISGPTKRTDVLQKKIEKSCSFGTQPILCLLSTTREGNVFTRICDSVHNWPHGYSVTANPCWLFGHSLLHRGRYWSYWNAFVLYMRLLCTQRCLRSNTANNG